MRKQGNSEDCGEAMCAANEWKGDRRERTACAMKVKQTRLSDAENVRPNTYSVRKVEDRTLGRRAPQWLRREVPVAEGKSSTQRVW
eukprot:6203431-Pleurochrysis_carterae.AAC.2